MNVFFIIVTVILVMLFFAVVFVSLIDDVYNTFTPVDGYAIALEKIYRPESQGYEESFRVGFRLISTNISGIADINSSTYVNTIPGDTLKVFHKIGWDGYDMGYVAVKIGNVPK